MIRNPQTAIFASPSRIRSTAGETKATSKVVTTAARRALTDKIPARCKAPPILSGNRVRPGRQEAAGARPPDAAVTPVSLGQTPGAQAF